MVRSYWSRVGRLALQESLRALSLDSIERAALRIIAAAIGVVAVWLSTKGGTTGELLLRIAGTVAILALFPLVYLWKLIATPAKMDKEAQDTVANLANTLDDYGRREQHEQEKQQLLDDISALRERVGEMRISMERDVANRTFSEKHWLPILQDLENQIASKIEQFASKAEAIVYRHRGNLKRPANPMMGGPLNERLVDICIHDLDHLRQFVLEYSRKNERQF